MADTAEADYVTEPDAGTHGRQHVWPRGKLLGGSSSINAMLRPTAVDPVKRRWSNGSEENALPGWKVATGGGAGDAAVARRSARDPPQ